MVSAARPQMILTPSEVHSRAGRLRLVLTDCDGVLTDGGVYYSDAGESLKRFSLRDGMGVERLREAGIVTAIVTREDSGCVARRAEKLRLPHLFAGVRDKAAALPEILKRSGCNAGEVAFIGDDVNDLGLLERVAEGGLTASPADGMPEVLRTVHYRCTAFGGQGAFREFAEWLLRAR